MEFLLFHFCVHAVLLNGKLYVVSRCCQASRTTMFVINVIYALIAMWRERLYKVMYSLLELFFVILFEGYVRNLPAHHVLRLLQYRFSTGRRYVASRLCTDSGRLRSPSGRLPRRRAGWRSSSFVLSEMNRCEPDLQERK